jgi:hypothetical protein
LDQDRILGESNVLEMYGTNGLVNVGEIDSAEETHQTEQKTTRPLGQRFDHTQVIHKGWELAIKGGKVDESVATIDQNLQDALLAGQAAPRYRLTRTVFHYDGTQTQYIYDNGVCYSFKESAQKSDDAVSWDFTFWAPVRTVD